MILQELIRNIFLYNGLVVPFLQSVKEHVVTLYKSSGPAIRLEKENIYGFQPQVLQQNATISVIATTGTHAIPIIKRLYGDSLAVQDRSYTEDTEKHGSSILTVLVSESIDVSSKTTFSTEFGPMDLLVNLRQSETKLTTGFSIENTFFYLSHETHERREYLGEFSLPHEEIHKSSNSERG